MFLIFFFNTMPFIDRDFIDYLSQRTDIVEIINKRLPLKKAGKNYNACCPFHNEKTPSFSVSVNKQFFHCFGCGESGGVIEFIKKFDHLGFVEAVETIASETGVQVVYENNVKVIDNSISRYKNLMIEVNEFYKNQLRTSKNKKIVVDYAKKRGISGLIAKRFELGYAPAGWRNIFEKYKLEQQNINDLNTLGMLIEKKDKSDEYYDRFRNRLMFPIHNNRGDIIGFGGRALMAEEKPKYLNSPEMPLFSKSRELYGLYHCRKFSKKIDYILVVEGYMDVLTLHQHGITTSVATLGTATTIQHLKTITRFSNSIVFCFDGDSAGKKAAWNALKVSLAIISSGIIIRFLFLPEGEDPDTIIKKESVNVFSKRIQKAQTLSNFLFEKIQSEVPFNTIEGKTLFLEKTSKLINLVNYNNYRKQLIQGLADILGQDLVNVENAVNLNKEQVLKKELSQAKSNNIIDSNIVNTSYKAKFNKQSNNTVKNLTTKMINYLINYPSLANDEVESRIKKLPDTEILLELIRSLQINNELTKEELIKSYKKNINIYSILQEINNIDLILSENEAKDEFIDSLGLLEKQNRRKITNVSIKKASTIEDEKRIAEDIIKRKKF